MSKHKYAHMRGERERERERERVEEPVMEDSKSLQSTWPSQMESVRLIPQLLYI